jgi:hypothetical protein
MEILPRELINEIKYFYQLPEFDIIKENYVDQYEYIGTKIYLIIKYQIMITKITIAKRLAFCGDRGKNRLYKWCCDDPDKLDHFINNLSNNIDCIYEETSNLYSFDDRLIIQLINNEIKITEGRNLQIVLSIESKNRLIEAMIKYRDLLKTYL